MRKRSSGGLSKPNCFSSSLMSCGSMPRAARLSVAPPVSPVALPLMRERAPPPAPRICAMTWSTGPPGATCTMAKLTTMIPKRVGTMSSRRRMM
jgi:hypothetical protein